MSLSKLAIDLGNIAKLDNEPNDVGGMTAEALKAEFDKASNDIKTFINDTLTVEVDAFNARADNPHNVTKVQVGLGNCDNTADADKPVSTAAEAALELKADKANVIERNNATVFMPTADYQPATKKYVDDTSASAILGQIPDGSLAKAKMDSSVQASLSKADSALQSLPAHKSNHASGGSDALTPGDIGASTSFKVTGTLTTAGWTGTAAPYTQDLSVANILESDRPRVDPVLGTDSAARDLIKAAWQLATTSSNPPYAYNGKITFYAASKPTTNIPVVVSVVRP